MTENPILVVDDDLDDQALIREAAERLQLPNPLLFFSEGQALQAYLRTAGAPPFLILCDVNLSGMDGFEVRRRVTEDTSLRYQTVPFIFWSTSASEKQIQHAYDLPAQGFFFKANTFEALCSTLKTIVEYWKISQHPKKLQSGES